MFEKADIRSVVILIDEYDVPLTYNLENKERFDSVAEVLKALYSTIKYYANKLRFVFITGITRYKDAAFFTLGNTILDVSLDPTYATIAGLTRDEIKHYYLLYFGSSQKLAKVHNNTV